jgi:arginase
MTAASEHDGRLGIRLIQVPYTIGDERHGASQGAERVVSAGAVKLLRAHDVDVSLASVERGTPYGDSASASRAVNTELARLVAETEAAGELPVVIAGSCDACLGIVGGLDHSRLGVVWIDAHADFNTPETTASGFFPGMSAAIITGHCYRNLWRQIGDSTPVAEAAIVMLGVRDLSPDAERERLERSAIQVVRWKDGRPDGDATAALARLGARVREVYLHIDLDGLDPTVAPGIVDAPVPGGLSLEELELAIRATAARFRVRAAAVTTFNPALDRDERTLRAVLRILELVAECARR